ncbi:winged helix-turn-helix transcriptional regulator [Aggregicoccus sp. 17bor-14]|uniref:metalloregulator ArsR/SmtB family transcription factor n=1 Tax=Myxococcaceae TaxID=31 RepID=UPI0012F25DE6|nr:winged helix-turn-helix transcriptional regulator [Simulacricoccus sp. 17bor-14]MRI89553.1 winged helix-turn-helix transcriptional regulator [Aggregicoccus sp. 17bor-14]
MQALTALADPTRRAIVEMLARGERSAGEVVDAFELSAPAVSQHLKVLRDAGLVQVRAEGQRRIYTLDTRGLEELDAWMGRIRGFWTGRLDVLERKLRDADAPRKGRSR